MRNKNACVTDPNSFVTCSGDIYHTLFSPVIKSDGSVTLVESGKDDINEFISSFREQTDMSYIIKKLAMGDSSVLTSKTPMFGDFTEMPKTYAESLQLVMDKEKQFMSLPLEVRNKFDNDFKKWFATAGSEPWMQKMESVIDKPDEDPRQDTVIIDPVKEDVKE